MALSHCWGLHDRAKSQVHNEGDRQAPIRYLADQGLAESEYGSQHQISKKLNSMHADAHALLQEK